MVTGNRYRHLVCVRRDIQVAVNNNHFDVAVVVGSYREVILRQTHDIVSNIGALRSIFAFRLQLDRDRLLAHVGRVAGHALLCGVVYLAFVVTGNRYRHLVCVRRDRQRARIVSNSVVSGDTRSSGLISGSRSDIRSDLQRSTKCAFNCRLIGIQRSNVGEGTGKLAAVIFFAIGLSRDRQRQRVVDGDDIAFGFDRDRLGRVIAVDRQVLPLIGRNRLCRVLGPDCLLGRHILRDRDRGALQVVVNRNFRLVQLEVRIVGVRLIDAVSVRAGNKRGRVTNMHCTIIAGPVVDDVHVRAGSSRRAGSRSGRDLDRLGRGSDSTPAGAVGSDRVVDGYIVLFPHSEEILIRLLLIGRNLRCSVTGSIRVARTAPNEEVRSRTALGLGPALEGIAGAGLHAKDVNSLVDLDAGVGMIERTLAVILAAVVAVPVDVRRGLYFLVLIDSLQLDGVVVVAGFNHIAGSNNIARLVRDLGIGLQCRKGPAGNDRSVGVFECAAIPGLQHPVVEDLACGCSGSCAGGDIGVVLVKCSVAGRIGSVARVIEDADALCADRDRTPLAIEVELLGDPETIDVRVGRGAVAPPVHGIREVRGLVIGRTAADLRVLSKRARGADISVPAVELIALAHSGGDRDLAAIADAEVHGLASRAPIQRGIRARVRVQEHTVLDLAPLGIDRQSALRHRGEGVLLSTLAIDVPSLENVTGRNCRGHVTIVRCRVRTVSDILLRSDLAKSILTQGVVVAINVFAVHEVDGIELTVIIEVNRHRAISPMLDITVYKCGI